MNKRIKIIGLAIVVIILYYALQYASSAVHYNCWVIKDDCPPPINLSAEFVYRLMVQPPWLDHFEIDPMTFPFSDGQFSFWKGEVNRATVVIRVREDESPVMRWIEEGLPLGIPIYPASGEDVKQWLAEHPDYELSE
jgi:hypothetical protein